MIPFLSTCLCIVGLVVDLLNDLVSRMALPMLLNQCAQGWVNNIIFTSQTKAPVSSSVSQFICLHASWSVSTCLFFSIYMSIHLVATFPLICLLVCPYLKGVNPGASSLFTPVPLSSVVLVLLLKVEFLRVLLNMLPHWPPAWVTVAWPYWLHVANCL